MMTRIPLYLLLASFAQANEALSLLEADASHASSSSTPSAASESAEKATWNSPRWPDWQQQMLDDVWARSMVFEDSANPFIQQIAITGHFNPIASFGKAEIDGTDLIAPKDVNLDSSKTRRARLGARLRVFKHSEIESKFEFAGPANDSSLERLSVDSEIRENLHLKFGKFRPTFTAEFQVEPEVSPYPDRSMLLSMIAPASTLGLSLGHELNDWQYGAAWFSGDSHPDIPSIDSDGFVTFNLAHSRTASVAGEETTTRWHLDFMHNFDAARSNSIPRYNVAGKRSVNGDQAILANPNFRNLYSTGFTVQQERLAFLGDFMLAKGETSAWGITLAPTWWAAPGLMKLVARYHYAGSDDPGALIGSMGTSSDLYFDSAPLFAGNEYHSFYCGANLHFYKEYLVLMAGLENVILKDQAGGGFDTEAWIWHAGLKASF